MKFRFLIISWTYQFLRPGAGRKGGVGHIFVLNEYFFTKFWLLTTFMKIIQNMQISLICITVTMATRISLATEGMQSVGSATTIQVHVVSFMWLILMLGASNCAIRLFWWLTLVLLYISGGVEVDDSNLGWLEKVPTLDTDTPTYRMLLKIVLLHSAYSQE